MDIVAFIFGFKVEEQVGCLAVVGNNEGGVGTEDDLRDFGVFDLQDIGAGWRALEVLARVEGHGVGLGGTVVGAIG